MPEIDNKAQWPGWTTTRLIGRGSFGAVYEIERDVFGHVEKAALKHMTIPQNEGDVEELRDSGYDDESITATFKSHIESIVSEYSLMRSMKGSANVVNCDDFSIMPRDKGIGWDILIKMELLMPLTKAIPGRADEEQVRKLANDMCSALMLCKKYNIVHRDIKPQNIFVSSNGDYKLGDFGIAKTMERTTGGTKIGTYKYMAPEVYNNQPYNQTADIYSLGLVLHWLLNEKRAPFMPLPPEIPKATDEETARQRRFAGEALPAPVNGSDELKRIVLKACAFNPQDRYQSAQEIKGDLKALEYSEYTGGKVNTSPETEKKENPEPAPINQAPQAQPEEDATVGAWQRPEPVEDSDATAGAWQRPEPVEDSDATARAWQRPEPVDESDATVGVWRKPEAAKEEPVAAPKKKSKAWIWITAAVMAMLAAFFLTVHDWTEPTCTEPAVCKICGKDGEAALGHNWTEATCTEAAVCKNCGKKGAAALDHDWTEVTCTEPAACKICGEVKQEATGHSWVISSNKKSTVCSICGEECTVYTMMKCKETWTSGDSYIWGQKKHRRKEVEYVEFTQGLNKAPDDAWDVSATGNRTILVWMDGSTLRIASDGIIASGSDSCHWMFANFENMTGINFGSYFDTSKATNMNAMFAGCMNLKEADLSCFNTSKVKDMGGMFNDCYSLEQVNLSSFNTSNVVGFQWMFGRNYKLKTVDLSSFDTSSCKRMDYMFYLDGELEYVDISNCTIDKNIDTTDMFTGCDKLSAEFLKNYRS